MWHYCDVMSTSVSQRTRVPRDEAKRRIVGATEALLRDRRYSALTIEQVMERAGLSRTVFYRYFDGLPHVLLGVLSDLLDEVVALTTAANRPGDPDVLRTSLARAVDVFDRHGHVLLAVSEAAAVDDELDAAYHALLERAVEATTELIQHGIDHGGLRAVSAPDVARALTIMNGNYLLDALVREPRQDPETALETLMTVWTGTLGMRAPRSRG
jgi:TetR/AcrR family transcriptional regulator, ethionamide resistance regulator